MPDDSGRPGRNHRIEWDKQPLGRVPDRQIAEKLGVVVQTVANARRTRGIPSHQTRKARERQPARTSALEALRVLPSWRERDSRRAIVTVEGIGPSVSVALRGERALEAADHIAALLRIVGQAELDAEREKLAEAERLLEEAGDAER